MGGNNTTDWEKFLRKEYIHFTEKYKMNLHLGSLMAISDFIILRTVGFGTYGRVVLAKKTKCQVYYAIKIIDKEEAIKHNQLQHCINEKRILQSIDFPFIIKSDFSFKDNCNLYIVMPFVPGGEMFSMLRQMRRFPEHLSKFYAVQVVLAFEYLHYLNIVHRDLKPENLLLGGDGYLKLVDLGFCKIVKTRTYTMCGTAEYMAPEIILSKGYGKAVDWWSFGVLIYEMCVGVSPFFAEDQITVFENSAEGKFDLSALESEDSRDIVKRLLQVNPWKRLGNTGNGVADIKKHPWFAKIDWLEVFNKREWPPYRPTISGPGDISCYDVVQDVPLKKSSQVLFEEEFKDF